MHKSKMHPVYFSLYLANQILGTEIPTEVLDALRPTKRKEKRIMKMLLEAGIMHPHKRKFRKLGFLIFQTTLYDSFSDFCAVLFPPSSDLRLKYKFKGVLAIPYYWLLYVLDMVGIRKSKKD